MKRHELAAVARGSAPDRQPDEIDGEEAAAADRVGRAEGDRRGRQRRDRRERADRHRETREDPRRQGAEPDADDEAEADLLRDEQGEITHAVARWPFDPRDQPERQRDRHRIVPAGFRLECPGEAPADVRHAQGGEHRRRIGRCDHRAEQQGFEPRHVEERARTEPGDRSRDHDADRAQQSRGDRDLPEPAPRRLKPALVEDQRRAP